MGIMRGMTGFGLSRSHFKDYFLDCMVRTFNHKYLELQISLPDELADIEPMIRNKIRRAIKRGYVQVIMQLKMDETHTKGYLKSFARDLAEHFSGQNVKFLIDTKRVMSSHFTEDAKLIKTMAEKKLDEAMDAVLEIRIREGKFLAKDISRLIRKSKNVLKEAVKIHKAYLKKAKSGKSDEEKARLLRSTDINEEIARLDFFLKELKNLMSEEKREHGRILDFYAQELLRESSTVLSKVVDKNAKKALVMLKAYFDSIRQQVQNIE